MQLHAYTFTDVEKNDSLMCTDKLHPLFPSNTHTHTSMQDSKQTAVTQH